MQHFGRGPNIANHAGCAWPSLGRDGGAAVSSTTSPAPRYRAGCHDEDDDPETAAYGRISEIAPRLLVSGAISSAVLTRYGITHVLSLLDSADELPWILPLPGGVQHKVLLCRDRPQWDLLGQLPGICDFIKTALAIQHGIVLVHCIRGVSRSPSAVVAFLIRDRGLAFGDALRLVKAQRDCVCPNLGFVRQLSQWGTRCRASEQEQQEDACRLGEKDRHLSSSPGRQVSDATARSESTEASYVTATSALKPGKTVVVDPAVSVDDVVSAVDTRSTDLRKDNSTDLGRDDDDPTDSHGRTWCCRCF